MQLYRYIALNPVRAKMVAGQSDYDWPSHRINALGKASALCASRPLYRALGGEEMERQARYRDLFKYHMAHKLLDDIRAATNKGMAFGNSRFEAELASLTGRGITANKMGRPLGWCKQKEEIPPTNGETAATQ